MPENDLNQLRDITHPRQPVFVKFSAVMMSLEVEEQLGPDELSRLGKNLGVEIQP
jgi:hypothetical protein